MNENLKNIIKERNLIRLFEILYFKIHKKKYNYVSSDREVDNIECNIKGDMKIAIYSCVLGKYDEIQEPIYQNENVDYYMFTDQNIESSATKWNIVNVNDLTIAGDNVVKNRYIKFHPHDFFENYEFSVYIDGNVTVLSNIDNICKSIKKQKKYIGIHRHNQRDCIYREADALKHLSRFKKIINMVEIQMNNYRINGFPEHYSLYENTIIIREHNNPKCIKLMNDWWEEYKNYPTRDQLSLPYVIKKNDGIDSVFILGNDLKKNPCFKYNKHK